MTTAYTVTLPSPAGLPADLVVRVVVMHRTGAELTRPELEAAGALYPPAATERAGFKQALALAPESRPRARKASPAKAPAKALSAPAGGAKPAKRTGAPKASVIAPKAPKRAAAKRPVTSTRRPA